jgi:hypothetical protein
MQYVHYSACDIYIAPAQRKSFAGPCCGRGHGFNPQSKLVVRAARLNERGYFTTAHCIAAYPVGCFSLLPELEF